MFKAKIYDIIKYINPECYKLPQMLIFKKNTTAGALRKDRASYLKLNSFSKSKSHRKKLIDLSIATDLR